MDEQPQLLTVKEASKELGLALTTVYAMMNTGAVDFVVIRKTRRGLNRRIPRSEIERLKPLYEIPAQEIHTIEESNVIDQITKQPD